MTTPVSELINPTFTMKTKSGRIRTAGGTTIRAIIELKYSKRPGKWKRAMEYAAKAETTVEITMLARVTMTLFPNQSGIFPRLSASAKFWKVIGLGRPN